MKRTSSKALIFVLVFMMIFSNFAFASTISAARGMKAVDSKAKLDLNLQETVMGDNQQVRIIVELKEDPVILKATALGVQVKDMSERTVERITDDIEKDQESVINSLESKIDMEVHGNFTNVFNGFATTVRYGDINTIALDDSVKKVYLSNEYDRPEPQMTTSPEITNSQYVNEILDYTGEGMVVAIIDTGIDPSHKDFGFTYTSIPPKLMEADVNQMITDYSLLGEFYTEKVPYGYNYMDGNNEIRDLGVEATMHGMHVAGTVAADGFFNIFDPEAEYIKGVAPKAQVLALKVFGNDPEFPSTFGDIIIAAIDDAIILGADVMNLSLGSTAAWVDETDPEQQAVARAVENGIVMSISAGNSAKLGDGYMNPLNINPDIGVVGSPGISNDSLQVASVDNTTRLYKNAIVSNELEEAIIGYGRDSWQEGEYELVAIGGGKTGYISDYDGIDVEGKIVLVSRGDMSFLDKTENAAAMGAVGIIVYNNDPDRYFYIDQGGWSIPFMKTQYGTGQILEELVENGPVTVNIVFDEKYISPFAGKVSSFSSWGTTPSLDFKPEIAAPGGSIYSTFNDDEYGFMSGTSMAAPHVAGGAALVLQRLDEDQIFADELTTTSATAKDEAVLAKNILMNTGRPTTDDGDGYASPRQQGAGSMDLKAAIETEVVVTDSQTGIAKVNLGEVNDDTLTFDLKVRNYGDAIAKFTMDAIVQTNDVHTVTEEDFFGPGEDYDFTVNTAYSKVLDADVAFIVSGEEVDEYLEVEAGSCVEVTVEFTNIDTDFVEENFPNGNFIEGFVFFRTHEQDLYNAKTAAKSALDSANQAVTDAENDLKDLKIELIELNMDLNGVYDEQGNLVTPGLEQNLEAAKTAKADFEAASQLLFDEMAALDELKAKKEAAEAAYDAALITYSDLVASKQEMADALDGIKNYEDRVLDLNDNLIPAKEQEIRDAKALLTDDYVNAVAELERLEGELQDLKDELTAKKALLFDKGLELVERQGELRLLNEQLAKLLTELDSLIERVDPEYETYDIDAYRGWRALRQKKVDDLQRMLREANELRAEEPYPTEPIWVLEAWCTRADDWLEANGFNNAPDLDKYIPGLTKAFLDEAIAVMNTDLANWTSRVDEYTAIIDALLAIEFKDLEIEAKEAEISLLELTTIPNLEAEILQLETVTIPAKEAEIAAQKILVADAMVANEATLAQIAKLEAELAELEAERDEKQDWLDDNVFRIQEVRKYFKGLATAKDLMDQAKLAMDLAVQNYNDAYDQLTDDEKAALADYETQLAAKQKAIDDLEKDIVDKKQEIADKEVEISEQEAEIIRLKGLVDEAQEAYDNADDAYYNALPLSVPFISFYGDWEDAPAFDAPWYYSLWNYYTYAGFDDSFYGVTGLLDADYNFKGFSDDTVAISPDGDGFGDYTFPVFSVMRNVTDVEFNIYDSEFNLIRTIDQEDGYRKNYFDGGYGDMYYLDSAATTWDGKADLEVVEDGQYFYVIEGNLATDDMGSEHSLVLPVKVDTIDPVIDAVFYEQGDDDLIVLASDENSGLDQLVMVELIGFDENDEPILEVLDTSFTGTFDLSELEDRPYMIAIVAFDYAENASEYVDENGSNFMIINDDSIPEVRIDVEAFAVYDTRTIDAAGFVAEMTLPTVWLDGEEVDLTYDPSSDVFTFMKTIVYEEDGKKGIDVTATDSVGNDINFVRHFYVDATAPVITDMTTDLDLIEDDVVYVDHTVDYVNFAAKVEDNFPDLEVYYNGSQVYNKQVDFVSYEEQLLPAMFNFDKQVDLDYGYNYIQLSATDVVGNLTSASYQVYKLAEGEEPPQEPATVVSIDFNELTSVTMTEGESKTLVVKARMSDGSAVNISADENLSVESNKTNTATVDGTLVKAIKAGNATLTATYEGFTATLTVNINARNNGGTNNNTGGTTTRNTTNNNTTTETIVEIIEEEVALGAALYQGAFIDGYSDGTFRPDELIKRSEVAKIISKILLLDEDKMFIRFADVDKDHWAYGFINAMKKAGLISGYGDYTYRPENNMSRGELAQILSDMITFVGAEVEPSVTPYTDIEGHWAKDAIELIYAQGIKTDDTAQFRPDDKVTRAETVVMINLFLGRAAVEDSEATFGDVPADHWAFGHIEAASR